MQVRPAETADLDDVRRLFRAFVQWHHGRQGTDLDRVLRYFDETAWAAELTGLPGAYAPPDGALLVAELDGAELDGGVAGCVALRRVDDRRCEMKRMYVDDAGRGHGIGRALGEAIVVAGREAGYREMYLDTSPKQHEAIGLYRSLGFTETEPYYDVPAELRDWLVYFKADLTTS
ncbi:GNAT family N-acetyltransferase [uncultured Nocardioides sp.]|mgnify:CR=1 FL=1|uniref:GNAT family N-acetyltransferase n=1 Tax=uncultured Nocardioides sp. TaxID=198441 RepID=UPI00344B3C30